MKKVKRGKNNRRRPKLKRRQVEKCYVRIGALVNDKRRFIGMTQKEVSDALGWSRASIANLEKGRQRVMLHFLPQLAAVLGTSLAEFLDPGFFV